MPSLQTLITRMRYWCLRANLGYDQNQRWNIRIGGECDCSSLVIHCLQEAGFDTGNASYTGNMSSNLTARGWKRLPANGNPQAGDILLADASHVAVYLGRGLLAQASIDERGRARGGASGDQTDRETNVRSYYSHPWDCYLRYSPTPTAPKKTIAQKETFMALLIHCGDDHCGYRKGDVILWQPSADIAFYHIPNPDALGIAKLAYPGIKQQESTSKAPWVIRAKQATPNPTGFGKR